MTAANVISCRIGACLALLLSLSLCPDVTAISQTPNDSDGNHRDAVEAGYLNAATNSLRDPSLVSDSRPRTLLAQLLRRPPRSSANDDSLVRVAQQTPPGGRPQTGAQAQEPININFENVSLMNVIESIGVQTGKNFDVDPAVSGQTVTIIAHAPVPANLAYEILESILASRGFALLETLDGNLIKVVDRRGQMDFDKVEIIPDVTQRIEGYDSLSIYVVHVKHSNAEDVAQLLSTVGSRANNIDVYTQTNTLVIRDTADGMRNMLKLLEVVDVAGQDVSLEIFTLRYTRAEALVDQILQVLGEDQAQPGQRPPVPTPAQRARTARAATARAASPQGPNIVGQRESVLRMVPDERLNALIVVASASLMDQVKFLVAKLDTPTPFEANNMHYIELHNADAEEVETALSAITSGPPREGGAAGGAGQTAEVQPFEKNVTITRYDQNNALLIVASPQDFVLLEDIIQRLDKPRRQVNVEAIIMEVAINDSFELTVEGAGLANDDAFALSNVVNLANAITLGPLSLAGPGATIGVIDGTTDIINPITGSLTTIQNIPFLLRALEAITELEVLSQPNLLTVDNEEAIINVGQEIPVIQSLTDVSDVSGFRSRGNINRQDVGVMLRFTPQIGEGDFVFMEIEVEVSSAVASTVEIDVNELGPTLQKSNILSSVVIGHGQTGIIGGLIRETRDRSISQTPIAGDLPLIGWLFRNKRSGRAKQNLVVLVTPHVLKRGEDMQNLTDFRVNEFYSENLDVIFEKGFIRKIRRKHYKREKYHPTRRYQETEGPQKNFNRAITDSGPAESSDSSDDTPSQIDSARNSELEAWDSPAPAAEFQALSSDIETPAPLVVADKETADAVELKQAPVASLAPGEHVLMASATPEELGEVHDEGAKAAVAPKILDAPDVVEPEIKSANIEVADRSTTAEPPVEPQASTATLPDRGPKYSLELLEFKPRVSMEDLDEVDLPESSAPEGQSKFFRSEDLRAEEPAPTEEDQPTAQTFTVQIGAFFNEDNASAARARFEEESPYAAHIVPSEDAEVVRVTVGSFNDRDEAETLRDRLRNDFGLTDCFVKEHIPNEASALTENTNDEGTA